MKTPKEPLTPLRYEPNPPVDRPQKLVYEDVDGELFEMLSDGSWLPYVGEGTV